MLIYATVNSRGVPLKRRLFFILLLIGSLALAVILADAQSEDSPTPTPNSNYVLDDGIFVRSGPGIDYDPIGSFRPGSRLLPLNRNPDGDWVMIAFGRGFGWVQRELVNWIVNIDALPILFEDNLTPSPIPNLPTPPLFFPTATQEGNFVVVNAQSAYLRAGPGRGYLRIGHLLPDDTVVPVGRDENTDWVMIRFEDGFGWIQRTLVYWVDDLESLPVLSPDDLTPTLTYTPSSTPSPTDTPTNTATSTDTATPTLTYTPVPTATDTPTPTLTDTPLPTVTDTPIPTLTDTPVPTETNTPIPTSTYTAVPTETDTPIPAVTDTPVPTATDTSVPTLTETSVPTATDTSIPTLTDTLVPTATHTPIPTLTYTPVPTETDTPSHTPTQTATLTPTLTPTDTPTETNTATETEIAAIEVPTDTSVPPTNTPIPVDTSTDTPLPPTETAMPPSETPETEPTATVVEVVAVATDIPPATPVPHETDTPDSPDDGGVGFPVEALVGAIGVLIVMVYIVFYMRGVRAIDRYADGFVIERCPVCLRGKLVLETKQERRLGIPVARRTVRCNECRSVLREMGLRRWRYAVDPIENPRMYERFNKREVTDEELDSIRNRPVRPPHYYEPRPPVNPPEFVDDEDDH